MSLRAYVWLLVLPLALAGCHNQRSDGRNLAVQKVKEHAAAALGPSQPMPEAPPPSSHIGAKDSAGCVWVSAEATVPVGENESRSQARAAALEKARDSAMRGLLGVDVDQRSLDFQQEGLRGQTNLIENILRTTRRGCILNEQVSAEAYRDLGECRQCAFFVSLRACIKERAADADRDFRVELSLSRDRFVENDEAKFSATVSRDAYLYVFDVGMDGETSLIVPNETVPQVQVRAGAAWEYPDQAAAQRGLRLVAQLPEPKDGAGKPSVSAEVLRVIATKIPLPAATVDPVKVGYMGVLQRLNASAYEWTEDAAAFTIYPGKSR
ncbi:MAG: DUF4384 domain-containing protein [Elusimicrobiota bacterium]|jgi:hypothetical protein